MMEKKMNNLYKHNCLLLPLLALQGIIAPRQTKPNGQGTIEQTKYFPRLKLQNPLSLRNPLSSMWSGRKKSTPKIPMTPTQSPFPQQKKLFRFSEYAMFKLEFEGSGHTQTFTLLDSTHEPFMMVESKDGTTVTLTIDTMIRNLDNYTLTYIACGPAVETQQMPFQMRITDQNRAVQKQKLSKLLENLKTITNSIKQISKELHSLRENKSEKHDDYNELSKKLDYQKGILHKRLQTFIEDFNANELDENGLHKNQEIEWIQAQDRLEFCMQLLANLSPETKKSLMSGLDTFQAFNTDGSHIVTPISASQIQIDYPLTLQKHIDIDKDKRVVLCKLFGTKAFIIDYDIMRQILSDDKSVNIHDLVNQMKQEFTKSQINMLEEPEDLREEQTKFLEKIEKSKIAAKKILEAGRDMDVETLLDVVRDAEMFAIRANHNAFHFKQEGEKGNKIEVEILGNDLIVTMSKVLCSQKSKTDDSCKSNKCESIMHVPAAWAKAETGTQVTFTFSRSVRFEIDDLSQIHPSITSKYIVYEQNGATSEPTLASILELIENDPYDDVTWRNMLAAICIKDRRCYPSIKGLIEKKNHAYHITSLGIVIVSNAREADTSDSSSISE